MDIHLAYYGFPIDQEKARIELTALVSLLLALHKHMERNECSDITGHTNLK